QWETLAQSLSSIAPTAAPAMVIPLVIGLSGRSAWLSFLVATIGVALVAAHVNVFARDSASPGSLYAFIDAEFGPWAGVITGWALLIAYIGTGAAVTGGVVQYAFGLLSTAARPAGAILFIAMAVGLAGALAYRNVELSTRFMLWIECASVATILLLFAFPSHAHRLAWDPTQWTRAAFAGPPIRAGLVLATFAFVGFESAAALGAEARAPLTTIPRAILGTALISGAFFIFCTYAEVGTAGADLAQLTGSQAPLQVIATLKGVSWLGPIVSVGAVISFFACTMACITAAARTALLMGRRGLLPRYLHRTHTHHGTPHTAVVLTALATAAAPVWLTARHVSAYDFYGWLGTIATYGFMTAYLLVVIAAPIRQFRRGTLRAVGIVLSVVSFAFLAAAFVGSINPTATPDRWLPVIFATILVVGSAGGLAFRRSTPAVTTAS
ncbi:MAG TPA: APC family permease, partial [Gemmatimonadaceae bacterium]|nr:APC family permease [Gemmatimonadaceae bacterium]